jgi:hypothetical protein
MKSNGLERMNDAYCDSCNFHGDVDMSGMTNCPYSNDVMIDDMACVEHYQAKPGFIDV